MKNLMKQPKKFRQKIEQISLSNVFFRPPSKLEVKEEKMYIILLAL